MPREYNQITVRLVSARMVPLISHKFVWKGRSDEAADKKKSPWNINDISETGDKIRIFE